MKKNWLNADGSFKGLNETEFAALDGEQKHAYYADKLKHECDMIAAKQAEIEKSNSESVSELTEEVQNLKNVQIETLTNAMKEQGRILEAMRKGEVNAEQLHTVEQHVEKALKENEEFIGSREAFKFDIPISAFKVAGDMTISGNVSGGNMPQALRLEGVNDIAERSTRTYPLVPKTTYSGNTIEWVYEANQDGTIDGTAEGTAKDQIDNDFVIASISMKKRAAYMKVSTEMLREVSFMSGWLRNKLIVRLFLDVDNQVLNGDGTGQNLSGIINQATAYAAGSFAGTVDNANLVDVLVTAVNQIEVANQTVSGLSIMLHPTDVANLMLIKLSATDKRYIDRLIMVGSTLTLDGVPIIKNNNMTEGDFLVGDFTKAQIFEQGSITVDVGLDGNDFTKNMRTILAEWKGVLLIETNDRTCFVTGDIATAAAALETP